VNFGHLLQHHLMMMIMTLMYRICRWISSLVSMTSTSWLRWQRTHRRWASLRLRS